MPAFLTPTTLLPFRDQFNGQPSLLKELPREGRRYVTGTVSFANYAGGGLNGIACDVGNISLNPLSQICALWVDTLQSDADISFQFLDSGFQLTVPARTAGLFPVNTQRTQFVIAAPLSVNADIVNFAVYNYYPDPVPITPPYLTTAVASAGVVLANGATQLIPAGTSGILTSLSIAATSVLGGAAAGFDTVTITDGTGLVVALGSFGQAAATFSPAIPVINLAGVNIRFRNGLIMTQAVTGTAFAGGGLVTNLAFR